MVHQTHEDEKNSPEFFEIDLLEEPDGSSFVSSLMRFDTSHWGMLQGLQLRRSADASLLVAGILMNLEGHQT
jgi:hypothetical protein